MDGFVSGWFEFISGHFLGVLSLAQARELGISESQDCVFEWCREQRVESEPTSGN